MLAKGIAGFLLATALFSPLAAQANHGAFRVERADNVVVILTVPAEGLFAEEQTPLKLLLYKVAPVAPKPGKPGVKPAALSPVPPTPEQLSPTMLQCNITMPSMPGMPAIRPTMASDHTSGRYNGSVNFPHGGDYSIAFSFKVPGNSKLLKVNYLLSVQDYSAANMNAPQPFTMTLRTTPTKVIAGKPTNLALQVVSRDTKKPVTRFDIVHEKKMHLMVVSQDLSYFFHVHPELHPDGTFTLPFTFPKGGRWQVFAEVAPPNVGMRPLGVPLMVGGSTKAVSLPNRIARDLSYAASYSPTVSAGKAVTGGLTLTLKSQVPVPHQTSAMDFTLTDASGKPVTKLPFWLAAPAHLVAVHEDVTTFVHSHPIDRTPADVAAGRLTFMARFPKGGKYRCWIQARQGDHVLTFPLSLTLVDRKH